MKTFSTSLAAAVAAPTKEPRCLYRFSHAASLSGFAFAADFTTGPILSPTQTYYQVAGFPTGNTQTVEVEQGRSTIGTFKIPFYDIDGVVTRYVSSPPAGLSASLNPTATTVAASIAGGLIAAYPPFGVIIVEDERMTYTTRSDSQFTGVGRGAQGTAAASHTAPSSLGNGNQIRPAETVQIFVGDATVAFSAYASLAIMQVAERNQTEPGVYEVTVQDLQRDLKKFAFIDAALDTTSVTNTLTRQGNPLSLLLQVWTTTSGGGNSAYDQGDGRGAGTPQQYITITSIEALRDSQFPNDLYTFLFREPINVKDWSEALLKTLNCYTFVTASGMLSVKRLTSSGTAVASLTMDTIIGIPKWQAGDRLIANQLAVLYDFGEATPGAYGTRELFSSEASRLKYGRKPPFVIEAQGVRTANSGAAVALNRATRFFERFSDPPPILQTDVHYSQLRLDIGDTVTVTHSWVPNLRTGTTGLSAEAFEITDMRPILSPLEGPPRVQLTLLHTGGAALPAAPVLVTSTELPSINVDVTPPGVPTGLTLANGGYRTVEGTFAGFITASWTAPSDADLAGFTLRLQEAGIVPFTFYDTPRGSPNVTITALKPGVGYSAAVQAWDLSGNRSAFSASVTTSITGVASAPGAPTGLAATGLFDGIFLTWTANPEPDVIGYRLQRSTTGAFGGEQADIAVILATGFVDANLGTNQTRAYRMRAENRSGGVSPYTSVVTAATAQIGSGDIADATVTATIIANLAIQSAHLNDNIISTARIVNDAITAVKLAETAVVSRNIGPNVIGTLHINDASITAAKIGVAAVVSAAIGAAVIGTAHIGNTTIVSAHIGSAVIGTAHILDGVIVSAKIGNAAVVTAKIGDAQINTAKIIDAAITGAKVGNAAISSAHIGAAQIGAAHIQDATITSAKIGNLQVQSAHINALTVGDGHIAVSGLTNAKLTGGGVGINTKRTGNLGLTSIYQTVVTVPVFLPSGAVKLVLDAAYVATVWTAGDTTDIRFTIGTSASTEKTGLATNTTSERDATGLKLDVTNSSSYQFVNLQAKNPNNRGNIDAYFTGMHFEES